MNYEYRTEPALGMTLLPEKFEPLLKMLGEDGWELVSVDSGRAYLKRPIVKGKPSGCAKMCANCKCFAPQSDKEASLDSAGWCSDWKVAMLASGSCEKFSEKEVGTVKSLPLGAVAPDDESAWHWQARTELGEKRVEAVTDLVAGVQAPQHRHRVVVIRDKNGNVVRGKAEMVNGHSHTISFMGMTDEADGHTHTFEIPQR